MSEEGLKLVSEVMEKMIDSQISNTQALTSLRNKTEQAEERIKSVETFFVNGFRGDIKMILCVFVYTQVFLPNALRQ